MNRFFKWVYIALAAIVLFIILVVALEFLGFAIYLALIIYALLIYLNYIIAKKFELIAFAKGQTRAAHAFEMCFWLGIVGYLYVIALPNANYDIKRLNQQKRIIELLQSIDEKTGASFEVETIDTDDKEPAESIL